MASSAQPADTASAPSAAPQPDFYISPADRDLMVRMTMAEAGGEPDAGKVAVAHTILNRTVSGRYGGDTPTAVITAQGQYEPWATRRGEVMGYDPQSPAYQRTAAIVDGVLAGDLPDPTGGMTHFLNEGTVRQRRGGSLPTWARGDGFTIGNHTFHAPDGLVTAYTSGGTKPAGQVGTAASSGAGTTGGTMPGAGAQTTAKAPSASDLSDADILGMLTGSKAPQGTAAAGGGGAQAPTPTASAPLTVHVRPTSRTADPASLSDDDLLGLIAGKGRGEPAAATKPAAVDAVVPSKAPVASPDGLRDPDTGALVVAGRGFTDNSADRWGGLVHAANGALLGAGMPLMAAVAAAKEKLTNGGDFGQLYDQARAAYGGARDQYRVQNPGTAAATELAGSIPTTVAATALGGAALGVGGNALLDAVNSTKVGSALAPYLAGAGRFVTGQAGRAVPAAAGTPAQGGNLLVRAASGVASGMMSGAFGGAINSGLNDGSVVDNTVSGAKLGAGIGAALPVVSSVATGTFNKLTGSALPELATLARTAQDYGFPVRAAEVSDSGLVRGADAALAKVPGMGYAPLNGAKQTALNRAVAGQIGETADRITPSVMDAARTRIGDTLDRIAAGSTIQADNGLARDFAQTTRDARSVLTPDEFKQLDGFVRDQIVPKFAGTGAIDGQTYQTLTRKGAPLDRLTQSDNPNLRFYAGQVRDALDDALERSAAPETVDALREARSQWRTLKILEPLVARDGKNTGNIDPRALYAAVADATPRMAYGGGGPLADVARAGQAFGPQGQGAQAPATSLIDKLAKVGGAAGAAAGLERFGPQLNALTNGLAGPALAGAAAGFAGGRLASSALRSNALTNSLIDRAIGTGNVGPVNRLMQLTGDAAPEVAAPIYNRLMGAGGANDNQARLDDFLRLRAATGERRPILQPIGR